MKSLLRRLAIILCSAAMLCGLLVFAPTAKADDVTGALDLVILLDNSSSMYEKGGNDYDAFRYDAAAIMLTMCQAEGTRATVLQFAGKTEGVSGGELKSIGSETNHRSALMKWLQGKMKAAYHYHQEENEKGATYLGKALLRAIDILDAGAADRDGRQPIILVLADGDDTINKDNPESNLEQARTICKQKGYKIYTVLLGDDYQHKDTLIGLSQQTSGRCFEMGTSGPSEMPQYFAQVFADQTGAELTSSYAEPFFSDEDGRWHVQIRVPNCSVEECNVMTPTTGLEKIRLVNPNGRDVTTGDVNVTLVKIGELTKDKVTTYRFWQYKIIKPSQDETKIGVWDLSFGAENASNTENVSVTVVFNYNLSLKGTVAQTAVGKTEPFEVSAQFMDLNKAQDASVPSSDKFLYRESTTENPAIVCKAYLLRSPEEAINSNTPFVVLNGDAKALRFSGRFSFMDILPESEAPRAKEYYIVLRAEGDGLVRTTDPIAITIEDESPIAKTGNQTAQMRTEDPFSKEADSQSFDISRFLEDPDGERDVRSVTADSGDRSIVSCEISEDNSQLILTSVGQAGSTDVTLKMTDYDDRSAEIVFRVEVLSVLSTLNNEYMLSLQATPPHSAEYQRGEEVSLTASFAPTTGTPTFEIAQYKPVIKLSKVNKDGTYECLSEESGTGTVVLDGVGGEYLFEAELFVGPEGNRVSLAKEQLTLGTGNVAPVAVSGEQWNISADMNCEAFPDTLLGHHNTEPWDLMFENYFMDENSQDKLTFHYQVMGSSVKITEKKENGVLVGLTIEPLSPGETTINLTATDDSSEKAQSEPAAYKVTVVDRNAMTWRTIIMIAAGAVVIFILFTVITNAVRVKFNGQIEILVGGASQGKRPLDRSKKAYTLNSFLPGNGEFTAPMASAVELRPHKDGVQVVLVKSGIIPPNIKLLINGKDLAKDKKAVLKRTSVSASSEMIAQVDGQNPSATVSWKVNSNPVSNHGPRSYSKVPSTKPTATTPTAGRYGSVPKKY